MVADITIGDNDLVVTSVGERKLSIHIKFWSNLVRGWRRVTWIFCRIRAKGPWSELPIFPVAVEDVIWHRGTSAE
jgi:hypothetical protein